MLSSIVENGMQKADAGMIASRRTGVVTIGDSVKGFAQMYFTIGDISVDGNNIAFPELNDTTTITSDKQLFNYLISKPFTLSDASHLSSGVYIYKLIANEYSAVKKMVPGK